MSRIHIAIILYLSQLRSRYRQTYFQLSFTSPTSSSGDISPIHLRTPLCLCTKSVILISRLFYPATRNPRRRVLVFGHRYRYLRYPCIVLVRHPHRILSTSLLSSYRLYGLAHNLAGARPKKGGYCHRRVCLKPESSDGNLVQPLNVALYVK